MKSLVDNYQNEKNHLETLYKNLTSKYFYLIILRLTESIEKIQDFQ